ncbi:thioesterase II family protein [Streptomyces sp. NPDC002659]|uniref:thioesterase II family protein n=1 Tax=Streptomyces sp. NPDC002659 TaxID=3364656 RepID=UPI003685620F
MTPETSPSKWFHYVVRREQPTVRLFCLSGAGAGPSEFISWGKSLPAWIETWPIQLPGRERRMREQSMTSLEGITGAVLEAVHGVQAELPGARTAFFGHSFGALVLYETCSRMTTLDPQAVLGIAVSGLSAPHCVSNNPMGDLSDSELTERIMSFGGTPKELMRNPQFTAWLLADIRNCYQIYEKYRTSATQSPLDCPVSAFVGRDDFEASIGDASAWNDHTTADFRLHVLDGGHFYLRPQLLRVLSLLTADLESWSSR